MKRREGFTLIELMVVIAIILLLLSILVGGMGAVSRYSSIAAAGQMLGSIQTALNGYKTDCDENPPSISTGSVGGVSVNGWQGGEILVQALSGPRSDDGKVGTGFASGGKNYGPYLSTKHESNVAVSTGTAPNARFKYTLPDSAGKKAVLYYRAVVGASASNDWPSVIGATGRFISTHNSALVGSDNPTAHFAATFPFGAANSPERAAWNGYVASFRTAEYLLIYPGPDDKYGTKDDVSITGK